MKAQQRGRSYQDDIYDLQQEVLRLREELQEERRTRVFAVAALNQRLSRLERSVKVQYSDEEEEEPPRRNKSRKPPVPSTKKSAFTKEVPTVKPTNSRPVKVVSSHESKAAMMKAIKPEPPSKAESSAAPPTPQDSIINSPALSNLSSSMAEKPPLVPQSPVKSPTSNLAPSTPQTTNSSSSHKVQFADELAKQEEERKQVFKAGEHVQVRCVEGSNEPRWDDAVVVVGDKKNTYCVRFPDGEEWAEVPVSELRKSPEQAGGTVFDLLVNENVYFSGFVWAHEMGWLQATVKKQWLMVLENKLYFASDPSECEFERELSLRGKTVETSNFEGSNARTGKTFSVKGVDGVHNFVCESEYDRNMWVAKIRLGSVKADPATRLNKSEREACIEVAKANARPVVPNNDAKVKAEDAHPCVLKGYVVSKSANAWFSKGDWARRWITLHAGFLTLRPNKDSPAGTAIIPLKDALLTSLKNDPENPYALEVAGPFIKPPVTLCFDSSPIFMKWCLHLEQSFLKANPELLSSGLGMQDIDGNDLDVSADLEGDGGQL
eukprot:TRINITY_DN566_c0_g2_i2.p1 TRINITY_DN566_c0_g2~~TRINITY_DN566_c0_g2_i2.p1  ORF type:complete len:549 (+),score=166.84 TRINITY_DN566_c0_g2_i2:141-1787(+)